MKKEKAIWSRRSHKSQIDVTLGKHLYTGLKDWSDSEKVFKIKRY